ncbi:unnamed protein product [Ostreobium quekettii]|uniref:Uncharacterized protein n=1 Tax=Ostreobium quekettii TaxID=121088 RepID=A0A8S1ISI7_9CHLO|nr:unnamed protein product [Ostreobium quekettii]
MDRGVTEPEAFEMALAQNDEKLVTNFLTPEMGRVVRFLLPALEEGGISVSIASSDRHDVRAMGEPCMMALAREQSEEFCRLFASMVDDMRNGEEDRRHVLLQSYKNQMLPEAPPATLPPPGRDQLLNEAVWTVMFRPVCADFSTMLQGMARGESVEVEQARRMGEYLVGNHMWHCASAFLRACLRAGIPVTWGPAAIPDEDLDAERLESAFWSMSS